MEYADRLPEGYEPLLIEEYKIFLKEIVEDELLLTLPAFPKHDKPCVKFKNRSSDLLVVAKADEQTKPKNPFAILAKLKPTGEQ